MDATERRIPKKNGRPSKGTSFAEMLRYYGGKKNVATGGRETYHETIVRKLIEQAADEDGDFKYMSEYFDRLLGRPRQAVEHEGGIDLKVTIDWKDKPQSSDERGVQAADGESKPV